MEQTNQKHICPWQSGPILASSLRKLAHDPRRILSPYLSAGMTAMDIGSGMGFFTIPMSSMVGDGGKTIAVDLQPEMLAGLKENARKAGRENIIYHQCAYNSLHAGQWDDGVDFALIFMMLHEVPDAERLTREVFQALAPGGKALFAEPIVHVSRDRYGQSLAMMGEIGFSVIGSPKISFCRSAVLQKPLV